MPSKTHRAIAVGVAIAVMAGWSISAHAWHLVSGPMPDSICQGAKVQIGTGAKWIYPYYTDVNDPSFVNAMQILMSSTVAWQYGQAMAISWQDAGWAMTCTTNGVAGVYEVIARDSICQVGVGTCP